MICACIAPPASCGPRARERTEHDAGALLQLLALGVAAQRRRLSIPGARIRVRIACSTAPARFRLLPRFVPPWCTRKSATVPRASVVRDCSVCRWACMLRSLDMGFNERITDAGEGSIAQRVEQGGDRWRAHTPREAARAL